MNTDQIIQLAERIALGMASEDDVRLFSEYCDAGMPAAQLWSEPDMGNLETTRVEMINTLHERITRSARIRRLQRLKWAAAAAVLLFFAGSTFYYYAQQRGNKTVASISPSPVNIPPGGNKALLTLANGTTIVLDSAANGLLAQQGNSKVLKTNNGQLAYNTANEKPTEVLYNTLATPRGGQYQLVLPDGSKVWLNAASSIRYPTTFTGTERKVEISGEAYLEVVKNKTMPFIVKLGSPAGVKGEVRVLGTQFNVNTYDDEPVVKTTLLEGAVQVKKDAASAILKPGQQSQLAGTGKLSVVNDADVEEVMAWKNGKMLYRHAGIEAIMRQAARWYDVDVVFKDRVEDTYTASVPRNVPISQLLEVLELNSGVHFTIEGKKITITK